MGWVNPNRLRGSGCKEEPWTIYWIQALGSKNIRESNVCMIEDMSYTTMHPVLLTPACTARVRARAPEVEQRLALRAVADAPISEPDVSARGFSGRCEMP